MNEAKENKEQRTQMNKLAPNLGVNEDEFRIREMEWLV